MTDAEFANTLSLGALVISGGSMVFAYLGDRRAKLAMQHSRKLAVLQLKKSIRDQISLTDSAIDKISTLASHMRSRLDAAAVKKPHLQAEEDFQELMSSLNAAEGAIDLHRGNGKTILAAIDLVGFTEAAEIALTKQLETVCAETAIASSEAWEVDFSEYERKVSSYELRP